MSATIKLTGDAVVITSSHKVEDYKLLAKYAPEKLILMGGEDNKEELFRVSVGAGHGSIGEYGAVFSDKTNNADGLATITEVIDASGDIKEYIADKFGSALVNLGKLEEGIDAAVEEVKAQRKLHKSVH